MGLWSSRAYRTIDDLIAVIKEASKIPSVVEIRIRSGMVQIRVRDGSPLPSDIEVVRLPSDDLHDRIRSGVDWKIEYRSSLRSAFLAGLGVLRLEGFHATHLASGDTRRLLQDMHMAVGDEESMTRWLGGMELIEDDRLEPEVRLLCGGLRAHGSIADIRAIVRLEHEVE